MGCSVITGYKKGHFMRRISWRNALCRVESIKSVGRFIIKQTKCTVRQGCWQLRLLNVAKSEWVTGTSSLSLSLLGIKSDKFSSTDLSQSLISEEAHEPLMLWEIMEWSPYPYWHHFCHVKCVGLTLGLSVHPGVIESGSLRGDSLAFNLL